MKPVITALENGVDDDGGWNFATSQLLSSSLFGKALQVWSIAQGRQTTVNEAAITFNVAPKLVEQAIEQHPYMIIIDNIIDHEGE